MPPKDNHSTDDTSASVNNPVDDIAALLAGDDSAEDTDDDIEESPAAETQDPDTDADDIEDEEDADELSDESTEEEEEVEESDNDADNDTQLHEMLGITEDQLTVTDDGDFLLNVKVDGKTSKHSLSEVIKNYQLDRNNTQKSELLSREREDFERGAQEQVARVNESLKQNQALAQVLEQEILADYEKVDWENLRSYDPAEYAAKRHDYSTKYQRVQRLQQQLGQQEQTANAEQAGKVAQQQKALIGKEYDKMLASNPTWADKDTLKKDMGGLKTFCGDTYGFTDKDFSQVTDSRLIELIKDAKLYREGVQFSKKKTSKKLPKFQKKVGGKRRPKVSKLDRLTNAARGARGSKRRDLQTDAVAELLNGG